MIGLTIDRIEVGDSAQITRRVTDGDIAEFVDAVGDYNPVHSDREYAAATAFKEPIAPGIWTAGLISAVIAVLVTDRFLELFAFGGLPQAAAIGFLVLAVAAFGRALRSPATERRWWAVGCAALLATCLSHVPTAAIGLPACLAAAALGARPQAGQPARARLRALLPLAVGLAAIGVYWLVVIAPASVGFVTNPASLSYRGPERVIDLLVRYPPTLIVIAIGGGTLAAWLAAGDPAWKQDHILVVTAALLIYLTYALLRPERF